jgi:hypothetical protein
MASGTNPVHLKECVSIRYKKLNSTAARGPAVELQRVHQTGGVQDRGEKMRNN